MMFITKISLVFHMHTLWLIPTHGHIPTAWPTMYQRCALLSPCNFQAKNNTWATLADQPNAQTGRFSFH